MADKPLQHQRKFDSRLRHSNQAHLPGQHAEGVPTTICRRIGFLLLEHFSMMAFTGAVDAIVTANLVSGKPLYSFETYSLEGSTVRSDLAINISVDGDLPSIPVKTLDVLIVCGGYRSKLEPARPTVEKLREAARHRIMLGGLWNGSYLLAHAGLLDGYACTVHPDSRAGLEEVCPQVKLLAHPFVIDRDRISSAGANSALSMMLAVIRNHHGEEVVRGVEEILSCDRTLDDLPDLPMTALADDPTLPAALRTVLQLMKNNIEEPLSIDDLAQHAQVSRRQIDRMFQHYMNATPARYYLETRITRARRLLQQTNEPITSIAIACGFSGAPHFSRCYREFFGVSPSQVGARRRRP
ncbi:GlxA family transcriptional regulator [Aromatoleum toluclasticum]|uniref:GlxA family transcriptional regulator n=1 Tax=Aromatoleum toluclasticum TaxID=92003 RepID=UPI0003668DA7|nr:GlxA family transcriptional regulator [Aromatoleum toluclasticum]